MQLFTFDFKALGCSSSLNFYANSQAEANLLSEKIIEDLSTVERKYSRYQNDSLVSKINLSAGQDQAVLCDPETVALIEYAITCYQQSEGLFDITSGSLRKAWNFSKSELPNPEKIRDAISLIGWNKVNWNPPYIKLPTRGMELDFGGFGKEYAVDRAIALAQELGINHGMINLGGDLRVIGSHIDGRPWRVGISHPRSPGVTICSLELNSGALATSGDYERYIEVSGKRYCHIINPKTGWPVSDFQSVSVISDSCLIAGSAATITMLLGKKQGMEFLSDLGLKYIAIDSRGEIESRL